MMLLEGKKAIVTGGARGIGKEIVLTFLREGADVVYVDMIESPAHEEFQKVTSEAGGKVLWKQCDASDEEAVNRVLEEIFKDFGDIDILVNNVGITRDGLIFRMKTSDWDDVIKINLSSAFYFSRGVAMKMAKRRTGSIISISSVVGIIGNPGQTNYCASKAGLIGFSKSLAKEVGARGIRVNVIAPGFIETEMTDKLPDAVKDAMKGQIPLGRAGKPEEVAKAALYLASDLSDYVTGHVLKTDGGMAM